MLGSVKWQSFHIQFYKGVRIYASNDKISVFLVVIEIALFHKACFIFEIANFSYKFSIVIFNTSAKKIKLFDERLVSMKEFGSKINKRKIEL